ncbi:glutamate racemase [candidate division TA06 bacterium]|uniref:Glutamate racemase n=1 Tax=candidate division TA06 bacterium TaxID=2250710 RepID=A0A933I7Y9_UNCT6|nr:glutamate racemase [candidate division TA06 bacterium]
MTQSSPIGIFDSGFGGLTIFKQIRQLLPQYDYIYLGDNARTPYGNRSFEAVLKFATEGVDYLFKQNCPLVVIACNTASAKALRSIQQQYLPAHCPERRALGVIRPTVEAIAGHTSTNSVALWATQGTVRSDSFTIEIAKHAPGVKLVQQACPMLVPLVEAGELEGGGLKYFIKKYWGQTKAQSPNIDTLLLACTHYPLILPQIKALLPESVRILSQDELVAPSLKEYLTRHPEHEIKISKNGGCRFLTTDACQHFDHLGEIFMGQKIASEKVDL